MVTICLEAMQLWLFLGTTLLASSAIVCIRTNAYLHAPSTIEKKYTVTVVGLLLLSSSIVL